MTSKQKGKVEEKKKGEFGCTFVYRGSLGVVCRGQNNGSTILSPSGREPAIEIFVEYGMGKWSVGTRDINHQWKCEHVNPPTLALRHFSKND
jgi:hypothetical protein